MLGPLIEGFSGPKERRTPIENHGLSKTLFDDGRDLTYLARENGLNTYTAVT